MTKEKKKLQYNLQLNDVKKTNDPTIIACTFVILDFEVSHNNTLIDKDVAKDAAPSLLNKAIVAKYHKVQSANTSTDAFGGHEAFISEDKHGELTVQLDTTAIGVFTSEGYIMEMGEGDNKKEVLACDAVLWRSRYGDAIDLLLEWFNKGIKINTSCEILYQNYTMKDGIEYIHSPIYFDGHCILNSEERGEHEVVLPAYEDSQLLNFNEIHKFNKLVAEAVNKQSMFDKDKEGEEMKKFKKVFELSHEDVRSLIYRQLDPTLGENTDSYVADVFDNYFIVNIYSWEKTISMISTLNSIIQKKKIK